MGMYAHNRAGRRLMLRFPEGLRAELGWKAGDLIAVAIGDGADLGRIRLERSEVRDYGCYRLVASSKRADAPLTLSVCSFEVGPQGWPMPVTRDTWCATEVGHRLDGAALVLDLPPWLYRPDEPRPVRRVRAGSRRLNGHHHHHPTG
jgi:hypothetical protein